MFDPERDTDDASRRFSLRLLATLAIAAAACAALVPSVTAFTVGVDQEKGCLAVLDGWHADRPGLTTAEKNAEAVAAVDGPRSSADLQLLRHAEGYLDWRLGPGACVPESHHRLIVSGLGLSALAGLVGFVAVVRRTRKNLRRSPAEFAEV